MHGERKHLTRYCYHSNWNFQENVGGVDMFINNFRRIKIYFVRLDLHDDLSKSVYIFKNAT